MEDYGYIRHAITLLSGVDEETGLVKVHPDNFLTKEQIKAVQDLVTFVKTQVDFVESPESDLGLVHKSLSVAKLLEVLKLRVPSGDWLENCQVLLRIDDKKAYAHTVTLVKEKYLSNSLIVIDG